MLLSTLLLFFSVAGINEIRGKKLEPNIKGTATYEPQNKYEDIYFAENHLI